MRFFEFLQNFIGLMDDLLRHSGHFRYMDAETMFAATCRQFSKEKYVVLQFLDGDIEIFDTLKGFTHLVQLVIVGSEQGFGTRWVFMQVFRDRPGYRYAVIGAGTAPDSVSYTHLRAHETDS